MRYQTSESTVLAGKFITGSTVTITIVDMETDTALALDTNTCTESTAVPGYFFFDTTNITTVPVTKTDCMYVMTNGVDDFVGKFVLGGILDTFAQDTVDTLLTTGIHYSNIQGTIGDVFHRITYFEQRVYVDTELPVNGDGSQPTPFNNFNDAKDECETRGIHTIVLAGEATLNTSLKNFNIIGIGTPRVFLNGQDCKNSNFYQCSLNGTYVNGIIARDCYLENGFVTNGAFSHCALQGTISNNPTGQSLLANCLCGNLDGTPTVYSMNSGTASAANITGWSGGLTIVNCDNTGDQLEVDMAQGVLTLDVSNTAGNIIACGNCKFTDESNGSNVTDYTRDHDKLIGHIYGSQFV